MSAQRTLSENINEFPFKNLPSVASDTPTAVIISDSRQNLKDTTVSTTQLPTAATTTTTITTTSLACGSGGAGSSGAVQIQASSSSSGGLGVGLNMGTSLSITPATLTTTGNHLDVPFANNPNLLSPDVLNQRRGKKKKTKRKKGKLALHLA